MKSKKSSPLAAVPAVKKVLAKTKVGNLANTIVNNYTGNSTDGRVLVHRLLYDGLDLETAKLAVRANGDLIRGTSAMRQGMSADQKAATARALHAERIVNSDGGNFAPGAMKLEKVLAVDKSLTSKSATPVKNLHKKYTAIAEAAAASTAAAA